MYGAMIGDIVGSKYEFHNIKTKDFPLFARDCDFNDDTIMTVGICVEIRASCHRKDDGIINSFIPEGRMYQLMRAFLSNGRPLSENVAGKQA